MTSETENTQEQSPKLANEEPQISPDSKTGFTIVEETNFEFKRPELPKLSIKQFICSCGKSYKYKKGLTQHQKKKGCLISTVNSQSEDKGLPSDSKKENLVQDDKEEPPKSFLSKFNILSGSQSKSEMTDKEIDEKLEKLRVQFKTMVINNKIDIKKAVKNEDFKQIDKMTMEELEARIMDAKYIFSKKIDEKIADSSIQMTNLIVGKLLNCVEELEEETQKNTLLKEATGQVLGANLLQYIPPEVKMGGLYALDVSRAYKKAQYKKDKIKEILKKSQGEDIE